LNALPVAGDILSIPVPRFPSGNTVVERDPRAMNRMDPATKFIHSLLEQWGKEVRERDAGSLPPNTLLGRVIEQGPSGAIQAGRPPVSLSLQSEHIEACWLKLWKKGQRCIKRYYTNWAPMEVMAKDEHMSVASMKAHLHRSRLLIDVWYSELVKAERKV